MVHGQGHSTHPGHGARSGVVCRPPSHVAVSDYTAAYREYLRGKYESSLVNDAREADFLLAGRLRRRIVECRAALFGASDTAEDLARFLWTAARAAAKQREAEARTERARLQAQALSDERRRRSYQHAPPLYVQPR